MKPFLNYVQSSMVKKPVLITPDTTNLQVEEVQAKLAAIHEYLHQIGVPHPNATVLESDTYIYVKSRGKRQKVCFEDIIWIESERNYVSFHTKNDTFSTLMPISIIDQQLPEDRFVRVHKSFIVALQKVNYTLKREIGVEWDSAIKQIPLGAQYRKNFLTVIEQSTAKRSKSHKPISSS